MMLGWVVFFPGNFEKQLIEVASFDRIRSAVFMLTTVGQLAGNIISRAAIKTSQQFNFVNFL